MHNEQTNPSLSIMNTSGSTQIPALFTAELSEIVADYFHDEEFRVRMQSDPAKEAAAYVAAPGTREYSAESAAALIQTFSEIPPVAVDASMRAFAALMGMNEAISGQTVICREEPNKLAAVATAIAVGVLNIGWAVNIGTVLNVAGPFEDPSNPNAMSERVRLDAEFAGSRTSSELTALGLTPVRQAALLKRAIVDGVLDDQGRAVYRFEDREISVAFERDHEGIRVLDASMS